MRVISQDGTIDVPYDYFSLSMASGKYKDVEVAYIYCHNLSSPDGTKLAEYSTREKAKKAMEMLRETYYNNKHEETYKDCVFDYCPNFMFPQDSEVDA